MGEQAVPTLMFATLGIALVIAILLYIRYHRRNDSHPMRHQRERNIEEIRAGKVPEQE